MTGPVATPPGPTADRAAAVERPPTARRAVPAPSRLTVLYDADCPLCIRCRHWLEMQPCYVPLDFWATTSAEAIERYGEDLPWLGYELVVVSDRGEAWIGPAAFLMCLWATVEHRDLSYRLSGPTMAPLAEWFFHRVSGNRKTIGALMAGRCADGQCRHGQ